MPDREEEKFAAARRQMVERDLKPRGIHDPRVLEAFATVPRERFMPASLRLDAYADRPLPIGEGQTISQPYIVALMLQELAPGPEDVVLDVGAGSGYQTALLCEMCKHVVAIERLEGLARQAERNVTARGYANVEFHVGDGSLGWPERAPYDGIICGAGAPKLPEAWVEQLADGGRIVTPVGGMSAQELLIARREGDRLHRRSLSGVRFVPLIGEEGWPG
jgi:protein-L-isoaspartate(D-aspartate) O-methyltransferase